MKRKKIGWGDARREKRKLWHTSGESSFYQIILLINWLKETQKAFFSFIFNNSSILLEVYFISHILALYKSPKTLILASLNSTSSQSTNSPIHKLQNKKKFINDDFYLMTVYNSCCGCGWCWYVWMLSFDCVSPHRRSRRLKENIYKLKEKDLSRDKNKRNELNKIK